jgi:hypothetical protein
LGFVRRNHMGKILPQKVGGVARCDGKMHAESTFCERLATSRIEKKGMINRVRVKTPGFAGIVLVHW